MGDTDLEYLVVKVILSGAVLTDLDLSGSLVKSCQKTAHRHCFLKFLGITLLFGMFLTLKLMLPDNKISSVDVCLLLLPTLRRLNIARNLIRVIHYGFGKLEEIIFHGWCFVKNVLLALPLI